MKGQMVFQPRRQLPAFQLQSFGSLAGRVWARLLRWLALHRQRRQLAALSDEMLKDIGRSRADIEAEASRPFWDDPLSKR